MATSKELRKILGSGLLPAKTPSHQTRPEPPDQDPCETSSLNHRDETQGQNHVLQARQRVHAVPSNKTAKLLSQHGPLLKHHVGEPVVGLLLVKNLCRLLVVQLQAGSCALAGHCGVMMGNSTQLPR